MVNVIKTKRLVLRPFKGSDSDDENGEPIWKDTYDYAILKDDNKFK